MSKESAVTFYEKLENDKELISRIQELQTPEAISNYVQEELGYDFTQEEMQKVIFERNPELTDEEMEAVIGGLDSSDLVVGGIAAAIVGAGGVTGAVIGGVVGYLVVAAVAA
ncbi:MAG TPA: Nif11-like leader peptide family RiPP precursor [Synergistaceae bacterium]|nr:Nif11-like leader peptide family RiPP precursor [Synergistaceae bacterium]HPJ26159.1 Nif11-like leader peptide family RiPP precursor [Synergistaceae bacterium]HPQ36873.1 Nif11-like leader peptide family RiPP precursor [Synergistaceae bacterium]